MTMSTANHSTLCRCCGSSTNFSQSGQLIGYEVSYFECPDCGYVQTEDPYWLEQAYSMAINGSDTGIMDRNNLNARIVLAILMLMGKLNGTVVDCAGGYGILVRLLRDYGVNALWSDRYCENLLARGFERQAESADLVTAFEAFEHFVNPGEELDRLLAIAPNVLLSTQLIAKPAPVQSDWWYYGKDHGQHIGFFTLKTLQRLAEERGKHLISNGTSYHLISSKPVSRNMWLAHVKLNRFMPFVVGRKLKSKIWSDFQYMSEKSK